MTTDQTTDQRPKTPCPKCGYDMIYVTAMRHPAAHNMQRTTFVCFTCNQTRTYMLPVAMAGDYVSA